MKVGIPKETYPGEPRVAMVPNQIASLVKAGGEVLIEQGAGNMAGYPDQDYQEKGATLLSSRRDLFEQAEVILQVRGLGANPQNGQADLELIRKDQIVIGCMEPLSEYEIFPKLAATGATAFALELIPRITRAQSMDVLSSMATLAGYKAVLMAAGLLPKMFPLMMTAAGTLSAAHVFVIGAGVAGLQAIATARRLGAIVSAYDVRPAVKEQVESLGAKFVELPLEAGESQDQGGYAKALGEDFYRRQRELMTDVLKEADVAITTAAVPGKKAPVLLTREMIEQMKSGSVVIDLAAERGGNCELTQPGVSVDHRGIHIVGPVNLPASLPYHASQMYARNIATFLQNMIKEKQLKVDLKDEIIRETMIVQAGEVVHPRLRELLNLPPREEK